MATLAGHRDDPQPTMEAVENRLARLPEAVHEARRYPLGAYRGLQAGIVLHPLGGTEIYLEGATTRRVTLMRDHPGPRAVLNAMERIAAGYGPESEDVREEIGVKRGQLADYEARLGMPFAHAEYMSQLTDLRDRLKLGLSEKAAEEDRESVAGLAEEIKALREANTVEAAPERTARKAARAERPVTARIRERTASVPEVRSGPEPEAERLETPLELPPAAIVLPVAAEIRLPQPVNGHAKAVVRRRQASGGEQLRLF